MQLLDDAESSHDHWHLLQDRDDQPSVDVPVGHRPVHEATYRDAADQHVLAHDRFVNDPSRCLVFFVTRTRPTVTRRRFTCSRSATIGKT
jgi:hypothetical protein